MENRLLALPLIAASFLALFILEKKFPLRKSTRKLLPRLGVNFLMAFLTFLFAMLLVRPVSLTALNWSSDASFGLLNLSPYPFWVDVVLGFLLLDLSFYYWHRLNHRLPFLWRFHNTHHIDPDLDVSTAFRFHFGEVAVSSVFRAVQVMVIGPSLTVFLAYEAVFQVGTFFHHSNLRLPKKVDGIIRAVFVTPRMHGIHHSNYKCETNSNYSVVFSFWDRLHRTFLCHIAQSEIKIGVPGYSKPQDNRLRNVLKDPFIAQKDYWVGRERR